MRFRKPWLRSFRIADGGDQDGRLRIIEPLTYMNNSGTVLKNAMGRKAFAAEHLLVVCDNLDLPPGMCRLKRGGKDAGHNGLKSIIAHLGTADFLRLYIGIGRPASGTVVDWVLGVPPREDFALMEESMERAVDAIFDLRTNPVERVMNDLNTRNTGKN